MPTVNCEVELLDLPNDKDQPVPSIRLTCERCGHTTESFGQRGRSLRRCLAVMKEECPRGEENFYKTKETVED